MPHPEVVLPAPAPVARLTLVGTVGDTPTESSRKGRTTVETRTYALHLDGYDDQGDYYACDLRIIAPPDDCPIVLALPPDEPHPDPDAATVLAPGVGRALTSALRTYSSPAGAPTARSGG